MLSSRKSKNILGVDSAIFSILTQIEFKTFDTSSSKVNTDFEISLKVFCISSFSYHRVDKRARESLIHNLIL
jgi:hypothetical protein